MELHLHLEGAIPIKTMWDLVRRHEPDPGDFESFRRSFVYRDFLHFIDVWTRMTNYLKTPEDFELIGESVARSLADQNIFYAEASVSPSDYRRHGLSVAEILSSTRRGLEKVEGTSVGLMVDLVRDGGYDRTMRVLEETIEAAEDTGTVGITIGGPEDGYPPRLFVDHYRLARNAGLGLSAHAGEAAGPQYVWSALNDLEVDRIGHGVRSVEDDDLVGELAARQVPLEVCPTSNIRTGVADGWDGHQVFALIDAGANVTINSDDPTYFDSSVSADLQMVTTHSGADPLQLTLNAVEAAFVGEPERTKMRRHVIEGWM